MKQNDTIPLRASAGVRSIPEFLPGNADDCHRQGACADWVPTLKHLRRVATRLERTAPRTTAPSSRSSFGRSGDPQFSTQDWEVHGAAIAVGQLTLE